MILVIVRRCIGIMALLVAFAGAQTAILECTCASEKGGRLALTFRAGVAAGMDVTKGTLLVHSRQAGPPPKLINVNGRAAPVTMLEQGWFSVAVSGREALKPLVEGALFDGPTAPGFAPYLVVAGPPKPKAQ